MFTKIIRELLSNQNILKIFYEYVVTQFPEVGKNNCCFCASDLNYYSILCDIAFDNKTNQFDFKNYNIIFVNNINGQIECDKRFEIMISGNGDLINTFKDIRINKINCEIIYPLRNYNIDWLKQNALPNNNKPIPIKGIKELLHEYTGPELYGEHFEKNMKIMVFRNMCNNGYLIGHDKDRINIIHAGWDKYQCNDIYLKTSNYGRVWLQNDKDEIIDKEKIVQKKEKSGLKFDYPIVGGDDYFTIIHRLVAETFLNKLENGSYIDYDIYKYVHHIDGNCYNNNENNLLWVTPYQHALIHPYLWNSFIKRIN
jgi:hypothetical protein